MVIVGIFDKSADACGSAARLGYSLSWSAHGVEIAGPLGREAIMLGARLIKGENLQFARARSG